MKWKELILAGLGVQRGKIGADCAPLVTRGNWENKTAAKLVASVAGLAGLTVLRDYMLAQLVMSRLSQ